MKEQIYSIIERYKILLNLLNSSENYKKLLIIFNI
jgi:hypothetical protein